MDDTVERLKNYEDKKTIPPGSPVIIRLDGRAFSQFTKNLEKPFDENFVACMIETAKHMVHQTNATIGYVQSDEISLFFPNKVPTIPDQISTLMFNGRTEKLATVCAGMASSKFMYEIMQRLPNKASDLPAFDARVIVLPNYNDAWECLKWRHIDAKRNSVSMVAHKYMSKGILNGLSTKDRIDILKSKHNVDVTTYSAHNREGTWFGIVTRECELPQETLDKMPIHIRLQNINKKFERSYVEPITMDEAKLHVTTTSIS